MDYQHKLADIQSEILMNNSLPPKEKSRYQYQIKDLQDMANYTKDTLDALESLPNSLSLPATSTASAHAEGWPQATGREFVSW